MRRTWINTVCVNTEGNECVCPRCRFKRELDEGVIPSNEDMRKRIEIIAKWDSRTDRIIANMAKRFPNE